MGFDEEIMASSQIHKLPRFPMNSVASYSLSNDNAMSYTDIAADWTRMLVSHLENEYEWLEESATHGNEV